MYRQFCVVTTLVLLALGQAQPAQAQKAIEPTIEVRMRSVNDFLDKVAYLGDIINQAEPAKQAVEFVRTLTDEKKGIEGIDPTKPFGFYGTITKDVIDSQVILMIPVADEKAFLDLLTGKLNLEPKKGDGDRYELQIPNVPLPVFFRFTNGYVYATAGSAKNLDDKKLLAPKDYFRANDSALASADVHLDRIPDDIKKTLFAQIELKTAESKNEKKDGDTPAGIRLRNWGVDVAPQALQTLLKDGGKLSLTVDVKPKSDDIALDVQLTAKEGSDFAKTLSGLKGRTGLALPTMKNPLATASAKLAIPEGSLQELQKAIDLAVEEAIAAAPENEKAARKQETKALTPTLKAGKLEATFLATERDKNGKTAIYFTMNVVEGKEIEKSFKQLATKVTEDKATYEFDVKKIGDVTFHKVVVKAPEFQETIGSSTIWVGISDKLFVIQITPDGKLDESLAKPQTSDNVRPFRSELSIASLFALTEKALKAEKIQELITEVFGKTGPSGKDTLKFSIEGGDALTMRISMKGKAFKLAVLIDQEKKK